jgi:hypothetical protein
MLVCRLEKNVRACKVAVESRMVLKRREIFQKIYPASIVVRLDSAKGTK